MTKQRVLRSIAVLTAVMLAAAAAGSEQLPTDPRIKTGTLGNGLKWMYRQHDNPPGKMAMLIHVDSGSLNEKETQRGLAHFLEHMAFNGSENMPPGELIPYFESIGMQFGPDINALTGYDQTVYMLFLPDTELVTVDKGLMVLSDYAFRLLILAEEIDKERGVILSEITAGRGPRQRLRDKMFANVFEGTRIAERLVLGKEEVVRNATRDDFLDYYRTWYRPENITLLIVGDAPPEPYLSTIEKWFGQYRATDPMRPRNGCGFKQFTKERVFIFTDPEHAEGNVDIYGIEPARAPTTTVEQAREDLIDRIGSWIIGRRFDERIREGKASYRSAAAATMNIFNDGMLVNASTTGEPGDWEKMLTELIVEVDRARDHGFLPQELELARKELLADAERAVETEPTRSARSLIMQMNRSVEDREPLLSAQQVLDLLTRLLPTVTLDEVNAKFAAHFKPGTFAYVLTLPEKEEVALPAEDTVLAAARAANARKTEAWVWADRPTELLEREPTPGQLVESHLDEDLQITSGWLSNGARLRHRYMDYKKDSVWVGITLAGGQIEETAENAGVTAVAALILDQPATERLRSTDVQDIMTGKKVSIRGNAEADALVIELTGSPKDLESGLQLAHALLTSGKLESSAFSNWKQGALQRYEQFSKMPQYAAIAALFNVTSGDDPRRMMLMPPDVIAAQSVARSQAWFDRLCREAPIGVTVVGDMQLDAVLPLIEKYIGALPARPRVAAHLARLRQFNAQPGPHEQRLAVDTITPIDMVIYGFVGCNVQEVPDLRALNLAALTLDSRLIKQVREEHGLVYSIGAQNVPGQAYNNGGFFFSGAPSREPGKGNDVAKLIAKIYATFAQDGPSEEELNVAKKQVANDLDTQLKEPNYWFEQLKYLDLHKVRLESLKNIAESYQAISANQVRDVFRKYHEPARMFDIIAAPQQVTKSSAEDTVEAAVPSGS